MFAEVLACPKFKMIEILALKTWNSHQETITKNRKVSLDGIEYTQVKNLKIPDTGLVVHLKNFGRVKVFRRTFTNVRDTILRTYLTRMLSNRLADKNLISGTLSIGNWMLSPSYKALCGIERFMVRTSEAIRTHILCSIRAFSVVNEWGANWKLVWGAERNLYLQVARGFILEHLTEAWLNSHNQPLSMRVLR